MQALRSDPKKADVQQQPSGEDETASRLDVFPSESEGMRSTTEVRSGATVDHGPDRTRMYGLTVLVFVILAATAGVVWLGSPFGAAATGTLRIETDAAGADVTIDGSYRGKTPLLLALVAGDHSVQVQQGSLNRTLSVSIAERTTVVHHIGLAAPPAAPVTTGGIDITSEPRGQSVSVDGQLRGVTPLTVTDLAPG